MITAVVDRQKSGYARDFRLLDVVVFNVMGFSLGLALSTNPAFIGAFAPGAAIALVIIFGAILAFFNGMTYGWFSAIMPSTGGDFIFVSRSIHHRLGFLTSWGFTATQLYGLAINITWILSVAVAPALVTLGVSTGHTSWTWLGIAFTTPAASAIGGLALLALYYFLAYRQVGIHRVFVYCIALIGLLGPVIMAFLLFSHSHSDFVAQYDSFMLRAGGPPNAYAAVMAAAKQNAIDPGLQNVLFASAQALPLGFLCFLGFSYSVYVGGEVDRPARSQILGILTALGVGFVTFSVLMHRYVSLVGPEFNAVMGNDTVRAQLDIPFFSMNYFIGMMASPITNAFMQVGNLMWFLTVPYVIIQVCTHNLVAWGCDRLTPDALLTRSRRFNTPWVSLLIVCLLAALISVAIAVFGFTLVGAAALVSVAFFLTGIGAFLLPRRRPDVFSGAPPMAKVPFLEMSLFQWFGLISAAGFAWIIVCAVWYAEMLSQGSKFAIGLSLAAVYGTGAVWYQIYRNRLARKAEESGVRLDDLFKAIPTD